MELNELLDHKLDYCFDTKIKTCDYIREIIKLTGTTCYFEFFDKAARVTALGVEDMCVVFSTNNTNIAGLITEIKCRALSRISTSNANYIIRASFDEDDNLLVIDMLDTKYGILTIKEQIKIKRCIKWTNEQDIL